MTQDSLFPHERRTLIFLGDSNTDETFPLPGGTNYVAQIRNAMPEVDVINHSLSGAGVSNFLPNWRPPVLGLYTDEWYRFDRLLELLPTLKPGPIEYHILLGPADALGFFRPSIGPGDYFSQMEAVKKALKKKARGKKIRISTPVWGGHRGGVYSFYMADYAALTFGMGGIDAHTLTTGQKFFQGRTDVHLSPLGHDVIAEALLPVLRGQKQ